MSQKYIDLIQSEASFLTKPYGRGAFYLFVGIIMVVKGGLLFFFSGLFVTLTGAIVTYSSKRAFDALNQIQTDHKLSDAEVLATFKRFDQDNSGYLDLKELDTLLKSLGAQLSKNDLESANTYLDKDGNGTVSQVELLKWWKSQQGESKV
jgi:hypothetical protein